jgi:hypothetical protein
LYRSLQAQTETFCLHVLCLDDECYDILLRADLKQMKLIRLPDLEAYDVELASARGRRTLVEYYFTLTAALPLFLFDSDPNIVLISYMDCDLFFFGNPEEVFNEMGAASVMIIGHRFPPAYKYREINGIYNVGFVTWKSDEEGRACLKWYRERTLEWCCDIVENNRFADQKYLDDWPARFRGVHVLQHKGCNVAPFNIENYRFSWRSGRLFVDDVPLIFYHFHGLLNWYDLNVDQTGINDYVSSPIDCDLALLLDKVYQPYIEALRNARAEITGLEIEPPAAEPVEVRSKAAPMAACASPWRDYLGWRPCSPTDQLAWERPRFFPEDRPRAWRAYAQGRRASVRLNVVDDKQAELLVTESILTEAAAIANEPLRILDCGARPDHIAAYRIVIDRISSELRTYVIVGAGAAKLDICEPHPKIAFVETLEAGLALRPHLALMKNLIEAREWYYTLSRLASVVPTLVLDGVRTLSGTDTLVAMRRPTGSAVLEPVWILNRNELASAFERLSLFIEHEFVWLDPVRLSYIPELADRRTFVLTRQNKDLASRASKIKRWIGAIRRRIRLG